MIHKNMHFSHIFPIGAILKRLVVAGPCNRIKPGNIYQKLPELKPCIERFHTVKWLRVLMETIFWGPPSSMALRRNCAEGAKKNLVPPSLTLKKFWSPPFGPLKKNWSPPPWTKQSEFRKSQFILLESQNPELAYWALYSWLVQRWFTPRNIELCARWGSFFSEYWSSDI